MTDRPARPRVSTLFIVTKLSLLMCHTPVTLIKTTYLLKGGRRAGAGCKEYWKPSNSCSRHFARNFLCSEETHKNFHGKDLTGKPPDPLHEDVLLYFWCLWWRWQWHYPSNRSTLTVFIATAYVCVCLLFSSSTWQAGRWIYNEKIWPNIPFSEKVLFNVFVLFVSSFNTFKEIQ